MKAARSQGRWTAAVPWIVLCLAAVLPFAGSLGNGFVYDDAGLVLQNPVVQAPNPALVWSSPYWAGHPESGLYRPWTIFSFWCDTHLFGRRAAYFHAVNLLLHLLVTLLVWRLLRRLFPALRQLPWLAALICAVHPLRSEAVIWIAGRGELWAAAGGLAAYLWAVRGAATRSRAAWAGSLLCYTLAVFSKEGVIGLMLMPLFHLAMAERGPALPGAAQPSGSRRWWLGILAAWAAPVLLLLLLRIRLLGGLFGLQEVQLGDNILAHSPLWQRIPAAFGFQWIFLGRLLFPRHLAADYSYPQIGPGAGWMLAGLAMLALGTLSVLVLARKRDWMPLWGLALLIAGGCLTANIVMPIGTVLAERLAYLPSIGSIWLLVVLVARLRQRAGRQAGRAVLVLAGLWMAALAVRSAARVPEWKSDRTLFAASIETSPRSCKMHANYAACLLLDKRMAEGLAESELAWRLLPGDANAAQNRGAALAMTGKPEEALKVLLPVAATHPTRPEFYLQLGNIYLDLKRPAAADSAFEVARRQLSPLDRRPLIGLASGRALEKRWQESRELWGRVARLPPKEDQVLRSWAYALWQAGVADSAEAVYREALNRAPFDASNQNDLAWFLLKTGRNPAAAVGLARLAFAGQPSENNADTLLEALLATGGCPAARAWADSVEAGWIRPGTHLPESVVRKLDARCPPPPAGR